MKWTILWALSIFILCVLPSAALPEFSWSDLFALDKWVHLYLYFFLYCFIRKDSSLLNINLKGLTVIAICLAYGIFIELFQEYILTYRSWELLDVVADAAGASIAHFLYSPVNKYIFKLFYRHG